jgi:hypothetical protein
MKPTMHLRWLSYESYVVNGEAFATPATIRVLQQFWEIAADESDITLPRALGPTGTEGRWMDVEETHR